jgi:ribose transport system permease protein
MLLAFAVGAFALKYSAWARRVLAIGGNEESAQLLGVQTTGTKVSVYVLSGLAAGLAGIVLASQTGSVSTDTGKGWELIAIAAVVIGGTLLSGGIGSVLGTFVGLLLMQLIFNVIVFENGRGTISISSYWESVIRDAFLLIVVLVQARVAMRRRR